MSNTTVLNRLLKERELAFLAAHYNADGSTASRPDAFDRLLTRSAILEMFLEDTDQRGDLDEYINGLRLDNNLEEER